MPTPPLELFRRLTTGVYVVTAVEDRSSGGFTAAWVMQVAFEPLLLAISVNPGNATWPLIERSGRFVINVLSQHQQHLAGHFGTTSGRDWDKLATIATKTSPGGGVVLADAVAWLDCVVDHRTPAGDHVVVIARVVGGEVVDATAAPLRYAETGNMDRSAQLYPPVFS